jgi:hypothetical protein
MFGYQYCHNSINFFWQGSLARFGILFDLTTVGAKLGTHLKPVRVVCIWESIQVNRNSIAAIAAIRSTPI